MEEIAKSQSVKSWTLVICAELFVGIVLQITQEAKISILGWCVLAVTIVPFFWLHWTVFDQPARRFARRMSGLYGRFPLSGHGIRCAKAWGLGILLVVLVLFLANRRTYAGVIELFNGDMVPDARIALFDPLNHDAAATGNRVDGMGFFQFEISRLARWSAIAYRNNERRFHYVEFVVPPAGSPLLKKTIRLPEKTVDLSALGTVSFDFRSATLSTNALREIRDLAIHMDANASAWVIIEGHADIRGTDRENDELAASRALSVANKLAQFGVNRSRMLVVTFGERAVRLPGNDSAAHDANRRSDYFVIPARMPSPAAKE